MKNIALRGITILTACLLVAVIVLVTVVFSHLPKPAKDDTIGVTDWLIVPVFYATHRIYAGVNGSVAYADEPNDTGLLFGVKNIAVPSPAGATLSAEKLQQMSWQHIVRPENEAGKAPTISQTKCQLKDQLLSRNEIVNSFQSYTAATGVNDRVVFTHGCCANFETSMQRAAKIAAHMGTPVLLYDWVSPVSFTKYLRNETRLEQTTDDFCRFLNNIDKVSDPGTVTLLGHSMGAMLIDEALVRRAIKRSYIALKPYREVIMSNADVDARTFLNHAPEFISNGAMVHLYISTTDDRLSTSALAHGRFARLGRPENLLNDLARLKGATVVDITAGDTGHEIPFSVVAALHENNPSALGKSFTLEECAPGYLRLKKTANTASKLERTDSDSQLTSCADCK